MSATIGRRSPTVPISHYWDMLKDIDECQKIELASMLIESVKPFVAKASEREEEAYSLRPYSMQEIDAMLDEAEAAFEAGDFLTNDEVFHHHRETVGV